MAVFTYSICATEAHLVSITKKRADTLEVRTDSTAPAILRIGNSYAKMEMGVGRVKLSTLSDGVLTPEIILNDRSVFLHPIRIRMGEVSLDFPEEILATLGARILTLNKRTEQIESELEKLRNAVFGKAIF